MAKTAFYWYFAALKKYAVITGRASRSEYWYYYLTFLVLLLLTVFIDVQLDNDYVIFSASFLFAHFIPNMTVSIRRLHDLGFSGWWYLTSIFPVIGPFIPMVFALFPSDEDNDFGAKQDNKDNNAMD